MFYTSFSRLILCGRVITLLCLLALHMGATTGFALYDDKPEVTVISNWDDFQTTVLQSQNLWLIQLCTSSSDDNGVCANMADAYNLMAKLMHHILYLGVIDVESEGGKEIVTNFEALRQQQQVPALYWFLDDKQNPQAISDLKDVESMIGGGMEALANVVTERAKANNVGMEFDMGGDGGGSKGKKSKSGKAGPSKSLSITGEEEFEEKIILNPNVIMVAFTAPWCGHCKMLKPDWDEAAEKLDGEGAQLAWIDATDPANEPLAGRFGVQGFPSILVFPGGAPKVEQTARQYPGERKARDIVQFVLSEVDRTGVPKEIPELINDDVLKAECKGHNHICVLAALPHIMDSSASGRNHYKDLVTSVSKTFRGSAFSFLWFEGGSQPALEEALELSFGFPALVAYSMDRHAYAVLRGSFSEKAMTSFLHGVTSGRTPVVKLKKEKVPKIESVNPWDGNDAPALEEEFDLSDIMGSSDDDEDEKGAEAKEEL